MTKRQQVAIFYFPGLAPTVLPQINKILKENLGPLDIEPMVTNVPINTISLEDLRTVFEELLKK